MKKLIVSVVLGVLVGLAASTAARQENEVDSRCIPCGPNLACQNPLTVCVAQSPSGHGCCLGFAN
jgi:hypothetical protein